MKNEELALVKFFLIQTWRIEKWRLNTGIARGVVPQRMKTKNNAYGAVRI
jgi:hypothetical protein